MNDMIEENQSNSETAAPNGDCNPVPRRCPVPGWVRDKWAVEWNESAKQFHIDEADYVIFARGSMDIEARYNSPWRVVGIFDTPMEAREYAVSLRRLRPEIFG